MQQLRKDNHYVPKLYLKQWAINGKIPTYRLLVPNDKCRLWKNHSIKGIAFHQHLYTYVAAQGETDEFERWLDEEFENPAEESIDRVINEQRLSPQHWHKLIRFLAAQDVRTPVRLREFLARQSRTLEPLLNETLASSIAKLEKAARLGVRLSAPENSNLSPFKITIERNAEGDGTIRAETVVGRRLWLDSCRHVLSSTICHLMAHRWTILHAPPGITWPTSDNPVIRLNFESPTKYDFHGGWGRKNGNILLPLSPKHLLYTQIGSRPFPRGQTLDEGLARLVRKMIIEHADRYVFAHEESDIEMIRPRRVCAETFKSEQLAWQNWHYEQSKAEADLLS